MSNDDELECFGVLPDEADEECRGCDARRECQALQRRLLQRWYRRHGTDHAPPQKKRTTVHGVHNPVFQENVIRFGYTTGSGKGKTSFFYKGIRVFEQEGGNWYIVWPIRRQIQFGSDAEITTVFIYFKRLIDQGPV